MTPLTLVIRNFRGQYRAETWAQRLALRENGLPEFFKADKLGHVQSVMESVGCEVIVVEDHPANVEETDNP